MKQPTANKIKAANISTDGLSSPSGEVPQAEGLSSPWGGAAGGGGISPSEDMPKAKGFNKATNFEMNYQPTLDLFASDFINTKQQKDFIPFGEDNLLPQQIVQLSRSVTIHRAIINSKNDFFSGTDLTSYNEKVNDLIKSINNSDETLHKVITKLMFDDINFGNAYFEIISDKNKSYLQFYHIDSSTCRLAVDGAEIIMHPVWSDYKGINDPLRTTLPIYPNFEKKKDGQYHSIFHIKEYEPEFYNYGLPTWYAGLNSLIIAGLTDRWNQNRLENQFNSPGMLFVPGVNSTAEEVAMDQMFNQYSGVNSEKSHTLLVQYLADLNPGQTREKPQFVEFSKNDEGNWVNLHIQSYNNMLSIHNWYKTLCSFFGEKTGFDTQRIINEYEIALNTSITTNQKRYLTIFEKIFSAFNYDLSSLTFVNQSPVYRLNPVKYIWELRKDAGLDYDPNNPKQKLFYSELKNTFNAQNKTGEKSGGDQNSIDNRL